MASTLAARKRGGTSAFPSSGRGNHLKGVSGHRPPPVSGAGTLDELIHHRIRLGIVSALAAADSLSFGEIKALLKTTDGNLSVHARKLESARYIECNKTFEDRRPRTNYRLAPEGRNALNRYLNHMEAPIRVTRDTLVR